MPEYMSDEVSAKVIPYIAYESSMDRMERANKRLAVALMISIVVVMLCNLAWLWAWLQYDYTSEEYVYTQDGQGLNIIDDSNEVNNGSESYYQEEEAYEEIE